MLSFHKILQLKTVGDQIPQLLRFRNTPVQKDYRTPHQTVFQEMSELCEMKENPEALSVLGYGHLVLRDQAKALTRYAEFMQDYINGLI